jgi:hypothetical protein
MGDRKQGSDSSASNDNERLNFGNGGRQASESAAAPGATSLFDLSPDRDNRGGQSPTVRQLVEGRWPASAEDAKLNPTIRNYPVDAPFDREPFGFSKSGRQGGGAATNDDDRNSDPSDKIRVAVGTGTVQLSEWVNSNLIVARYAAYAGIGLLAAYGISHSPLFFRYKTVADIPSHLFLRRRKIKCRLVADTSSQSASSSSALSWESSAAPMVAHGAGPIRFKVR